VQNENGSSRDGSNNATPPDSQLSCDGSLQLALQNLAAAIAEQNQALWALIGQTAALIEMVAQGHEEDSDEQPRYLDGSRVS
jgi:hypothetical protein